MKKGFLELGGKPDEADIKNFLPQLPKNLPSSYINFLKNHNGAIGDLPVQPFYFQLWQLGEALDNNEGYEVQEYLPGYFAVGSNGGDDMLALKIDDKKIYSIPFAPMEEESAFLVAESFEAFESIIGFTEEAEQNR